MMSDRYTELAREWLGENVASEEDGGDWLYATADDLATLLRRVARETRLEDAWVIEQVDYESYVVGLAESPTAGIELIKSEYPSPYVVRWEKPRKDSEDEWWISGHFSDVPNYSIKHTADFRLTRHDIAKELED